MNLDPMYEIAGYAMFGVQRKTDGGPCVFARELHIHQIAMDIASRKGGKDPAAIELAAGKLMSEFVSLSMAKGGVHDLLYGEFRGIRFCNVRTKTEALRLFKKK